MKNIVPSLLALSVVLLACNTEPSTDPIPYSVEKAINQPGLEEDFEVPAVKASGIVSSLGRDSYPLVLFLTGEDNLKAYIKE